MKKSYDDIEFLLIDAKKDIDSTLASEVFEEARDCQLEHVEMDVFSVYQPKEYLRRSSGGIDDPGNIIGEVKDGILTVENITPFNPGYGTGNHGSVLAELINGGHGSGGYYYDYPSYGAYTYPRPFIDNTVKDLEMSNRLEDAMKKGLAKRNMKVK